MDIEKLVGKRCLLKINHGRMSIMSGSVEEYKILEIAPSKNWAKVMNINGYRFWIAITNISFVEQLQDITKGNPNVSCT